MSTGDENVRVAVRCRPLSKKELAEKKKKGTLTDDEERRYLEQKEIIEHPEKQKTALRLL